MRPARLVRTVRLALQLATLLVAGRSSVAAQAVPAPSSDSIEVAVAARRLPRGAVLRAGDISLARVVAGGPATRRQAAVHPGWVTRRVIQPGEVLRPPAVAPAPLVAAGQAVQFTYQHDGLALTLDGVAPVAGSLGDTIPVRLGARRRVTGVVAGPARVVALSSVQYPEVP
jgi:flagella basal body P-ring formation protein FlgA